MESESLWGLPDLADLPLEALLTEYRPDALRTFRIALSRRAAAGLIFAGHTAVSG